MILVFFAVLIQLFYNCTADTTSKQNTNEFDTTSIGNNVTKDVSMDSTLYYAGQSLFKANCNKCHVSKNKSNNYLEGVVDRVGKEYLSLYLTKQDSLISIKDSYALKLKGVWKNMENSHNFKYSTSELAAIIEYLK
jgi:nitrate/TMAO reductase-like tetraheme cytochrome c subunit